MSGGVPAPCGRPCRRWLYQWRVLRCGLLEFEHFCGRCELLHRCVQFLLISERLIKCSLYPTPQGENHSGYRVG
nr:MAG TPA: hypothetical protein [Caudoviricetes sp.]